MQAQGIASTVLRNKKGVKVHLISTGAIVQRLLVPDARGRLRDVVLGFDNPADYNVCPASPDLNYNRLYMYGGCRRVYENAWVCAGVWANVHMCVRIRPYGTYLSFSKVCRCWLVPHSQAAAAVKSTAHPLHLL